MDGITTSPEDQAIVYAVGHLAEKLHMEIVAEGIETVDQLDYARRSGIHNVQGFLMAEPQPESVITDMVVRGMTIEGAIEAKAARKKAAARA